MSTETQSPSEAPAETLNWHLQYAEPGVLVYSVPGLNPPTRPLVRRTVDRESGGWVPLGTPAAHEHPVKHSALHYAEYIGRVGVLAAALGVGAAIAGPPGIARAEPGEADATISSSSSRAAAEKRSTAEDTSDTESTTAHTSDSETTSPSETADEKSADAGSDEADPDDNAAETETATDTADEDPDKTGDQDTTEADDTTAPVETPDAPTDTSAPQTASADDEPSETVERPSSAPRDTRAAAEDRVAGSSAAPSDEPVMLTPAPPEEPARVGDAGIATDEAPVSARAARTAAESAPAATSVTETPVLVDVAQRALDPVATPLAPPASPGTLAAQTPLLWGLFDWARRPNPHTPLLSYDPTTTSQLDNIITGHVTATDPDSDPLTLTASKPVNGGTVVMHPDGSFSYTLRDIRRAADGTDTFTVTATDSRSPALAGLLKRVSFGILGNRGHTATTTVTVNIAAIPAPQAGTPGYTLGTVRHGTGAVAGDMHVTGYNTLTYTLTGGPTDGQVDLDAVSGAFVYTPTAAARHEASAENATADRLGDTFTITVDDNHGGVVAVPVAVTIDPSNSPPSMTLVVSDPDSTGTVHVTVTVVDPDNDPTTYLVVHDPAYGTLTATPGGYDYTPNALAATDGVETITVTATDLHHGAATETASVTVSPVNTALTRTAAAAERSSTGIQLPASATVFTLRGRSFGKMTPDRMNLSFGGIFAEDPYSMVKLNYPTWGINSIKEGVKILDAALMSSSGDIIVSAHSEGAEVASRWMRQYANDPTRAALAGRVTFLLSGNPLRVGGGGAIGKRECDGVIGVPTPTTTPWPIIDVARRWDGWADWPTDATNAWAIANATAGQSSLHMLYSQVDLYSAQNTVWREGNTTFVLTREAKLPMLSRYWAAPADFQSAVRAKVEAGYVRPANDIPVPVQQIKSAKWQQVYSQLVLKYGA